MLTTVRTRLAVLVLLSFTVTLLAAGCTPAAELPYETTCDCEALRSLIGQDLLLLRFAYEEDMLVGDAAEPAVGRSIAEDQKDYLLTALEPYFNVGDATDEEYLAEDGPPAADDREAIREILDDANADGAILVTSSYGYELSGDIASDIVEQVFGVAMSERVAGWFQALSGPSLVSFYHLVSDTAIVDRNGRVVWRFFGKVNVMPRRLSGTAGEELATFTRSLTGVDPTAAELSRAMNGLYEPYTAYLAWVLDSNLEGSAAINYFTDYPGDTGRAGIFPALDRTHVPAVRTAEEIAEYRESRENSLWAVAKSSSWRTFGQWRPAWAALKLLGISLLIAIPLAYISDKLGADNTDEPGCLQYILLAFSVTIWGSLYLLLKAVL